MGAWLRRQESLDFCLPTSSLLHHIFTKSSNFATTTSTTPTAPLLPTSHLPLTTTETKAVIMSSNEQFLFSCINHSNGGTVCRTARTFPKADANQNQINWQKVADECGVPSKGAA